VRTRPDGDRDGRVTRGYLFNCLQLVEPVLGTRCSFGVALTQKVGVVAQAMHGGSRAALNREAGAKAMGVHGGPGAAPSREAGARAAGASDGPGAAQRWEAGDGAMGTHGGPGAAPSREAGTGALGHAGTRARLVLCLDLELVRGGTRSSGYRQY
jgi:hypothetical protein